MPKKIYLVTKPSKPVVAEGGSYLTLDRLMGYVEEPIVRKIIGLDDLVTNIDTLVAMGLRLVDRLDTCAFNYEKEVERAVVTAVNTYLLAEYVQSILKEYREYPEDTITAIVSTAKTVIKNSKFAIKPESELNFIRTLVLAIQYYAQCKPKNFMYS